MPEKYRKRNYKKPVNLDTVKKLIDTFTIKSELFDPRLEEISKRLNLDIHIPTTPNEALDMYKDILQRIDNI